MRAVGVGGLVLLALLLLPVAASASRVRASVAAQVDLGAPRQVIQGFGTSERMWSDPHLSNSPKTVVPAAVQEQILTALYRRLGLTFARDTMDPGIQAHPGAPIDFSFKPDAQAAWVKQARRYGLKTFFPSPVYLERWMQANDPASYVDWAMALLQRWRALGLVPTYYSVLNEPQVAGDFPTQWLHDVVVQLGQRLRGAGFKTKLVIPDDANVLDAYRRAAAVLQDPNARQYVGAVAFHIYGSGGPRDWARLRQLASTYRLPLWMTEYESTAYTSYAAALDWAVKMHQLLTIGNVNVVQYLWGFFGDWVRTDTLISIRFENGVFQSWSPTPLYYLVGQYSKYVRPGDVRVTASSDDADVLVSAYRGGARRVVVIATNTGESAKRLAVRLQGTAKIGSTVQVVRTTPSAGLRPAGRLRVRSRAFGSTLPPQSVTTFVVAR